MGGIGIFAFYGRFTSYLEDFGLPIWIKKGAGDLCRGFVGVFHLPGMACGRQLETTWTEFGQGKKAGECGKVHSLLWIGKLFGLSAKLSLVERGV